MTLGNSLWGKSRRLPRGWLSACHAKNPLMKNISNLCVVVFTLSVCTERLHFPLDTHSNRAFYVAFICKLKEYRLHIAALWSARCHKGKQSPWVHFGNREKKVFTVEEIRIAPRWRHKGGASPRPRGKNQINFIMVKLCSTSCCSLSRVLLDAAPRFQG